MVANNYLEIKIGFNSKNPEEGIENLVHTKTGLLYDEEDEAIFFIGSVNETASGWANNIEAISVDNTWEYKKGVIPHIKDFEDSWNGNFPNMTIMNVPEASEQALIRDAPNDIEQLKKLIEKIEKRNKKQKQFNKDPYPHQQEAINSWLKNDKKGILTMATGTGKTLTSLWCLKEVLKQETILTVIACPYIHLIEQWKEEIENLELGKIYEFYCAGDLKWGEKLDRLKSKINNDVKFIKPQIILTSHDTFYRESFKEKIKKINEYY